MFFTGRMLFLPPNQQRQSTEGNSTEGECTTEQNKHKKPKPDSVAFCDIRTGNGAGLFSK